MGKPFPLMNFGGWQVKHILFKTTTYSKRRWISQYFSPQNPQVSWESGFYQFLRIGISPKIPWKGFGLVGFLGWLCMFWVIYEVTSKVDFIMTIFWGTLGIWSEIQTWSTKITSCSTYSYLAPPEINGLPSYLVRAPLRGLMVVHEKKTAVWAHRCFRISLLPIQPTVNNHFFLPPRRFPTLDKNNSVKRVKEPAELAAAASDAFAVTPAASSRDGFVDGQLSFLPQNKKRKGSPWTNEWVPGSRRAFWKMLGKFILNSNQFQKALKPPARLPWYRLLQRKCQSKFYKNHPDSTSIIHKAPKHPVIPLGCATFPGNNGKFEGFASGSLNLKMSCHPGGGQLASQVIPQTDVFWWCSVGMNFEGALGTHHRHHQDFWWMSREGR